MIKSWTHHFRFSYVMCPIVFSKLVNAKVKAKGIKLGRPQMTKDDNQVKRVCKLACERANADCSTSVSAALKHSTSCHRSNGDARKEYI